MAGLIVLFFKSSPSNTEVQLGFENIVLHQKCQGLLGQRILLVICTVSVVRRFYFGGCLVMGEMVYIHYFQVPEY